MKIATGSKITDSTANSIGVSTGTTVDDALALIGATLALVKQSVAEITLTIKDISGNVIPGIQFANILDSAGNPVESNTSGIIKGYIAEGTQTLSISGYADLEDFSDTVDIVRGTSIAKAITLTTRNFLKIVSSQSVKFSGNVNTVDVTVVGGGGGGGRGVGGGSVAGGGGGYCVVKNVIEVAKNTQYSALIGAGGTGGKYTSKNGNIPATSGGTTSFMGVNANGGGCGGAFETSNGSAGDLGNGNGNGGFVYWRSGKQYVEPTSGTVAGYSSFTDTTLYGGGGGGCGGGEYDYEDSEWDWYASTVTKTPYGGYGGYNTPINGTSGFGGGGGGMLEDTGSTPGGNGGSGCVTIRMHLKTAS